MGIVKEALLIRRKITPLFNPIVFAVFTQSFGQQGLNDDSSCSDADAWSHRGAENGRGNKGRRTPHNPLITPPFSSP